MSVEVYQEYIRVVSTVIAIEYVNDATHNGTMLHEDYPELPEGVWSDIVTRLHRVSLDPRPRFPDFEAAYKALSALAEEV